LRILWSAKTEIREVVQEKPEVELAITRILDSIEDVGMPERIDLFRGDDRPHGFRHPILEDEGEEPLVFNLDPVYPFDSPLFFVDQLELDGLEVEIAHPPNSLIEGYFWDTDC
jgi:hypothetical protein